MRALPNLLTLLEVALGFAQLAAILSGRASWVPGLACAALLADYLAGRTARGRGLQSGLGAELDALAGLMAFAIGPLVYLMEQSHPPVLAATAGAVAAALKLSRDNASSPDWPRYQGLPVAAFGMVLVLAGEWGLGSKAASALILTGSLALVAPLTWKRMEPRRPWSQAVVLALALASLWQGGRLLVLLGCAAYIVSGAWPTGALPRAGRRARA